MTAKSTFENFIKERIFRGEYAIGGSLESERSYSKEFGLSLNMVHRTLQKLVEDGYLKCRRNKGYEVLDRTSAHANSNLRVAFITSGRMDNILAVNAAKENIWLDLVYFDNTARDIDERLNALVKQSMDREEYDAILIHPYKDNSWIESYSLALKNHYPIIFRDFQDENGVFPMVGPNHFEVGFLAAKTLKAKGYKHPVYFGYTPETNIATKMRLTGFLEGCAFFGLDALESEVFAGSQIWSKDLPLALERVLQKGNCDVIFGASGTFTLNITAIFEQKNIKIPEQMNFLGVNFQTSDWNPKLKLDCICENFEVYAAKTLKMIKDAVSGRFLMNSRKEMITPVYREGNSLQN
jgi:DNA-binding LacI/PurR family transcriptional regulator